jgi:hypothetical protein
VGRNLGIAFAVEFPVVSFFYFVEVQFLGGYVNSFVDQRGGKKKRPGGAETSFLLPKLTINIPQSSDGRGFVDFVIYVFQKFVVLKMQMLGE